jgi:hypothetical protein
VFLGRTSLKQPQSKDKSMAFTSRTRGADAPAPSSSFRVINLDNFTRLLDEVSEASFWNAWPDELDGDEWAVDPRLWPDWTDEIAVTTCDDVNQRSPLLEMWANGKIQRLDDEGGAE